MTSGTVLERLTQSRNLSKADRAVARWIKTNLQNVPLQTAGDIAACAGVNEKTITRFIRHLGYENFKAFKTDLNADLCLRRGVRLIAITDRYRARPRKYTPHVLSLITVIKTFLDGTARLSALLGLLLNNISARMDWAPNSALCR